MDREIEHAICARITALEVIVSHLFSWIMLRDDVDAERLLDELGSYAPSRLPKGVFMDASDYQKGDEEIARQKKELCEKLRREYRSMRQSVQGRQD